MEKRQTEECSYWGVDLCELGDHDKDRINLQGDYSGRIEIRRSGDGVGSDSE